MSELLQCYEQGKYEKVIAVCLKSGVDSTENNGEYKQYGISII